MKAIYGLFDESGKCRYVGLTGSARKRKAQHEEKGFKFRVLRFCENSDGGRLERQIALAYKRKGQCDLNGTFSLPTVRPLKYTTIEGWREHWSNAGRLGGRNRAQRLTPERRREIARLGGLARARN